MTDLRPLLAKVPHRYPYEVRTTALSGIEYALRDDGSFLYAWRSIDGHELTEDEFVRELLGLSAQAAGAVLGDLESFVESFGDDGYAFDSDNYGAGLARRDRFVEALRAAREALQGGDPR